jgi:Arc/MetJ-type ribon-helix-helix transcriptional regulator
MRKHHYFKVYDVMVRTTITLDPDVAERIQQRVKESKFTFKEVVNQALRAGLQSDDLAEVHPFVVQPHACGFKAGIDLDKMNQLVDEFEAEESTRKLR